jgi:hypothetical protein
MGLSAGLEAVTDSKSKSLFLPGIQSHPLLTYSSDYVVVHSLLNPLKPRGNYMYHLLYQ